MLTATVPLDLGRPPAGWIAEGNAAIERNARAAGALVLDLRGFGARNLVMADHVHPTAFGQVAIAERALAVLAADGMTVRARPSALIAPSRPSRPRRLQGDATYAYRHAKVSARAAALIARERLRSARHAAVGPMAAIYRAELDHLRDARAGHDQGFHLARRCRRRS